MTTSLQCSPNLPRVGVAQDVEISKEQIAMLAIRHLSISEVIVVLRYRIVNMLQEKIWLEPDGQNTRQNAQNRFWSLGLWIG